MCNAPIISVPTSRVYRVYCKGVLYGTVNAKYDGEDIETLKERAKKLYNLKNCVIKSLKKN
jgi:hypothetical protein